MSIVLSIFWGVIALFYLVLAIVTYITGKPVLDALADAAKQGDTRVWVSEKRKQLIGQESLWHRAFKAIFITDVVGFILAAIAATIPALLV